MAAENATKGKAGGDAGAAIAQEPKIRPRKIGIVKSDKMQKTITIVIERLVKHPVYKKYVRERTILKAHDEKNVAKIGNVVEVEFTRPLSKTKRWNLVRVIRATSAIEIDAPVVEGM